MARPLLSRAWSGSSMVEGVSNMVEGVKSEIPDTVEEIQKYIQEPWVKAFE